MDNAYAFKLDHIKTGKSPIPRDHFPSLPGYSVLFPGMILIKYGFGKIVNVSGDSFLLVRSQYTRADLGSFRGLLGGEHI